MIRFDRRMGPWSLLLMLALVHPSPASAGKTAKSKHEKDAPSAPPQADPSPDTPAAPPPADKAPDAPAAPPKADKQPEAPAAPAGKTTKPGAHFPGRPAPPTQADPTPGSPAPAAPQSKGWPHAIVTASTTSCNREPLAREVLVYRDANFTGACAVLVAGFYPFAANFLIGDDQLTSIKVGSEVRARVFKDEAFSGSWNAYPPGTRSAGLGEFDNRITSIRVEPSDRSQICDDVREGEVGLYQNPRFEGDCVVLPGEGSYPNPEAMGIANDRISSIYNNSARRMQVFWDKGFTRSAMLIDPHKAVKSLSSGGYLTDGINDNISSMQMKAP